MRLGPGGIAETLRPVAPSAISNSRQSRQRMYMSTGPNRVDEGSKNRQSEPLRSHDAQPPAARDMSEGDLAALLRDHSQWLTSHGFEGKRTDLSYTNCENVTLDEARLQRAFARGVNLHGASMRAADLSEADLSDANLYSAQLQGAALRKANLHNCDLRSANLRHADLSEARGLLAGQLAGEISRGRHCRMGSRSLKVSFTLKGHRNMHRGFPSQSWRHAFIHG